MTIIGLGDLTTLYTSTTVSSGDNVDPSDIATTLSTTLSLCGPIVIQANVAHDYVSSMSDEQIEKLISKIDDQESLVEVDYESAKVKTLGTMNKNKI